MAFKMKGFSPFTKETNTEALEAILFVRTGTA